jgi:uncharacterized NAD(P)/FAD-binding protein YdhS
MIENCNRSILIAGGGFSGAVLVIQLARHLSGRLDVVMVEPSAEPGRGVAYSTQDPAHLVNVPTELMALSEEDADEATRWFVKRGTLPDPQRRPGGERVYVPRHDYGTFVSEVLRSDIAKVSDRLSVDHRRTVVKSIVRHDGQWLAALQDGKSVRVDSIALCFGHSVPRIPFEMGAGVAGHAKFVSNPWANGALSAIGPRDSVLVVGTGLTMVDVVLSLRERGHEGHIDAVSRHGLTPRPHGDFRDCDGFLDDRFLPATALELLRAVRRRVREIEPAVGWQSVADAVSAKLPAIWRSFPTAEKVRAIHRLLPFWDVHRFRIPPQSHEVLQREVAAGTLTIAKAGVAAVASTGDEFSVSLRHKDGGSETRTYDAVVVCTGPDKNPAKNELVAALLKQGLARLDDTGLGIAVDGHSRVLDAKGLSQDDMFAFGPMTRSSFGEMSGANDIAAQIGRVARDMLAKLPRDAVEAVLASQPAGS